MQHCYVREIVRLVRTKSAGYQLPLRSLNSQGLERVRVWEKLRIDFCLAFRRILDSGQTCDACAVPTNEAGNNSSSFPKSREGSGTRLAMNEEPDCFCLFAFFFFFKKKKKGGHRAMVNETFNVHGVTTSHMFRFDLDRRTSTHGDHSILTRECAHAKWTSYRNVGSHSVDRS